MSPKANPSALLLAEPRLRLGEHCSSEPTYFEIAFSSSLEYCLAMAPMMPLLRPWLAVFSALYDFSATNR